MNDMRAVIVPKSDQINSDDLLAGPITITITNVSIKPGTEQPVSIFFDGDGGKPYKPCKSMARVMVNCWGADANEYIGRSMTLYCDPKVLWGGMAVGGIRISHMSHIDGAQTMALTATKGSRKPFTVKPLKIEAPKQEQKPRRTKRDDLRDKLATCASRDDVIAMNGSDWWKDLVHGLTAEQVKTLQDMVDEKFRALPEPAEDLPEQEGMEV